MARRRADGDGRLTLSRLSGRSLFAYKQQRAASERSGFMRILIVVVAAAMFYCGAAAAQSVGGKYTVKGTNLDGSSYRGTAVITPAGSACLIAWDTGSGSISKGICMLANKAFAASYVLDGKVGLVVYEVQPDSTLKGVWTIADTEGAGTEVLTPVK